MKRIFSLIFVSVLSFSLIGCFGTQKSNSNDTSSSVVKDEGASEVFIKHSKGETAVPKNPSKIAVFDFGILDTLDAIGVNVDMAIPTASLPKYLEKYKGAVNAGGIKEPDIEGLYNFQPQIIFISNRQADFYDQLNEIAPTVFVDLNSATYLQDLTYNAQNLGEIFDKQDVVNQKLKEIEEKIKNAQEVALNKDEKALVILTNDGNISAYGSGSRFGMIHDVLGVKAADENIQVSTHGQEVGYEYIAKVNPDILFVVDRTSVVASETTSINALDNDLIKSTNAYKNNKIINLDPEAWYISSGGLISTDIMVSEIQEALNQ